MELHELISINIGFNGNLYVLLAKSPTQYRTSKSKGPSFARIRPDELQEYKILTVTPDGTVTADQLPGQPMNFHAVQPLPNGDMLLACARAQRRGPSDYDLNGVVLSKTGEMKRAFLLGDGLQDVQVDELGTIWTSYFDEGIFGNYGWDQPIGVAGLVAWDQDGKKLWEYDPPHSAGPMCDCYALNVESTENVWLYYYTDFPLVRLSKRKAIGVWRGVVSGSSAFAISGEFALFSGGYEDGGNYYLYKLRFGKPAELVRQFTLENLEGWEMVVSHQKGRHDSILLLCNMHVYRLTVLDCLGG